MKTIIAGSREGADLLDVQEAVNASGFTITEVVSGVARGVDSLGEEWAAMNGIQVQRFPADWDGLGRAAGFIRNGQMAAYAGALVAIWDGRSPGTRHMIRTAEDRGLKVHVYIIPRKSTRCQ